MNMGISPSRIALAAWLRRGARRAARRTMGAEAEEKEATYTKVIGRETALRGQTQP